MTNHIEAGKLTKEARDNLPDSLFAVPETRQLPMHDLDHIRKAWAMVDETKGLSDAQRSRARQRILKEAKEKGMDTTNWNASAVKGETEGVDNRKDIDNLDSLADYYKKEVPQNMPSMGDYFTDKIPPEAKKFLFSAMAIEVPPVEGHPNRIPFSGVLTKLDEPSDMPVGGKNGGSQGKRVVLPKDVAERALPSLMGMAVDFRNDLSGHDAKQKCGVITEANVKGNQIVVAGFLYAADFDTEVKRIQTERASMGMSYEAQVQTRPMSNGFLLITDCVFTGAAILYKDKAAYKTTSFTAEADEENIMSDEILKELKKLGERMEKLEAGAATKGTSLQAGGLYGAVEPHANALRAAANDMCAAGVGDDATNGHAAVVRRVANHMLSEASQGRMPHVYQGDNLLSASKATDSTEDKDKYAAAASELEAVKKQNEDLQAEMEALKAGKFAAAAAPARQTVSKPNDPAIAAKANAGAAKPQGFDHFYAEAEKERGITDPASKAAYALKQVHDHAGVTQ